MIYGYSAQNLCKGGTRFVLTFDTPESGTFQAGEIVTGSISSATARIVYVDNAANVMRLIATSGVLVATDLMTGGTSSATGTISTIEDYDAPRSAISGTAGGGTPPTLASGSYVEATANYQTSDKIQIVFTGAGTYAIDFDRGGTSATNDPLFLLLSRLVVSDYDYTGTQDSTATNLTSITWLQDTSSGFGSADTLATVTNATTAYGPAPLGLFNIFVERDSAIASTKQHQRVLFTTSGAVTVTVGGVWIGAGFDTVADGSWNFQNGFNIAQINRNISTEQDGGAKSERPRQAIRRWSITPQYVRGQWQDFYDAARGDLPNVVDSSANPWVFCLDPDSSLRAVTGKHWFSGMFKFDGTVTLTDTGANKDGEFFLPRLSVRLREHV